MASGINFWIAKRLHRRLYYGWVTIAVVLLANLSVYSVGPTFGLFIVPLETEFGWDRATIARSITLGTVMGAMLAPLLGMLVDRFGTRPLMVAFGLATALCFGMLGSISRAWQYNLLIGLIFALGWTGVGQMMGSIVINRWFVRHRGRAMGMVMMGASGGALIFIPLCTLLIAEVGWRLTYGVLGLAAATLICLPVFLLMVNLPEQLGLAGHPELSRARNGSGSPADSAEVSWTLREAARTRVFWITLAGVMLGAFSVQGYFIHAVPHMEAQGFSRALASTVWSAFFLVGVFAKFGWGFVIERIGVRRGLSILFAAEAGGLYLLLTASTPAALFFYAVVNGIGHAPYLMLLAMVWAEYFGRQAIGRIYGTVQPAIVIAGSLGPWLAGYLYDLNGDYRAFFSLAIAMCLLASVLFLLERPPLRRELPADGAG